MKLLFRYIFIQSLLYVFIALAIASGIYVLADLFDRIDNFISSDIGIPYILWYYLMKIPMIAAQVMPSCFLLATLAQLCIMARSRELVALQAGGIPFTRIALILLCCGFICGLAQFFFSQSLGVYAERNARRFWTEDVQKGTASNRLITNLWFEDGIYKVHVDILSPLKGTGHGFTAYLSGTGSSIEKIIWAKDIIQAKPGEWVVRGAVEYSTTDYRSLPVREMALPLRVSARSFEWYDTSISNMTLPLWELGKVIDTQRATGSNVESLRTAWHMKLSVAASLMVLALVSVAVITWRDNIYLCMALGLIITFFLFLMMSLSPTLGSHGVMSPFWAAWFPNAIFFLLAMARLIWFHWPHRLKENPAVEPA